MRDEDFNSADEQGKKAQGGDPVSDADEGRVPRSNRRGWERRGGTWDTSGITHSGMVACAGHIAHAGREAAGGGLAVWPAVKFPDFTRGRWKEKRGWLA